MSKAQKEVKMKKIYFVLALLIGLLGNVVWAEITIEILDQNTPTGIHNGEYRELLHVQITTETGDVAQIRCATFFINNTFSWLEDLRFEQLQWKEGDDWVSPVKVNSEWDVTVPCWFICLPNETKIITLWGKVVTSDFMNENKEFQIGWNSSNYLWLSGSPIIEDNFPQYKNIIIIGDTSAEESEIPEIVQSELIGNYPNPFNPNTMISFYLPSPEDVKLEIYNVKGQKVKTLVNNYLNSGQHRITWNGADDCGKNVSSGVYFYKIKADKFIQTKKMILTK
jgi:hypothetical protein